MNARILMLVLGCACGQSTAPTADGGCHATYAGNYAGAVTTATCATLGAAADGGADVTLNLTLPASASGVQLEVQIDLGPSPASGDLSSESVSDWSALGVSATTNCLYSAGAQSVPPGNFTLTLTSVSSTQAHGSLHVEQTVHGAPTVDCGAGDLESVDLAF